MPRIARLLAINYPHHITQRGNNKETVFFDEEDRKFYLKLLKKYSDQWNFNIWAYFCQRHWCYKLSLYAIFQSSV
jgi:putative transposase